MSRRALLLALAALAPACRSDGAAGSEALDVLARQQAAWNRGDVEGFAAEGYRRSPELVFFSGGEVVRGYDTFLERFRRRYGESTQSMGRLAFAELELLAREGPLAVVRGRWRLERDGAEPVGGLFTLVLRRFPEGWRIVHDHTSVAGAG